MPSYISHAELVSAPHALSHRHADDLYYEILKQVQDDGRRLGVASGRAFRSYYTGLKRGAGIRCNH
ncbi:hypothetical protein HDF18_18525 [Mucilaginibacter sp. X5P1]|uniref:hypothetical protein n=1 Tax=Mucilaginibacter sp. X5P1 TaxID=2723088 RepID=UPI0016072E52|nr:hypothetical protein [Mucilaginibacter sp. X5P1]MBB6139640.1 hypothetical protein [Mucilaginibacter sp. X5P1]